MADDDPFKRDHDLVGCDPVILMSSADAAQIEIRTELIDHSGLVARRSGRFVHLGISLADAMQLLALLKGLQKQLGLPDHAGPVRGISVPPAKDRN